MLCFRDLCSFLDFVSFVRIEYIIENILFVVMLLKVKV